MQKQKRLLSIGEASEYLSVSIDTLRRWEKKGKIESLRSPGNHRYFSVEDLDKLFGKKYRHDKHGGKSVKETIKPKISGNQDQEEIIDNKVQEEISKPEIPYLHPPISDLSVGMMIVDRPARDIKIPEAKLIKVIRTDEEIKVVNERVVEMKSEEITSSILTPTALENTHPQEIKNIKEVTKISVDKNNSKNVIKKNILIYTTFTLIVLMVIAAVFFLIGVSSQRMISPIP